MTELTPAHLHQIEQDDRYIGWGYIGERHRAIATSDTDREQGVFGDLERIWAVDAAILRFANDHNWTYENLLAWANSKYGRWLADSMFNNLPFDQTWASAVRELVIPTED